MVTQGGIRGGVMSGSLCGPVVRCERATTSSRNKASSTDRICCSQFTLSTNNY